MAQETLTKENFWDEMEQKYPKAMAHFKAWVDQYKSEHDWESLFRPHLDEYAAFKVPKYHELPIAMQFGIFLEFVYPQVPRYYTFDQVNYTIKDFIEDWLKKLNRNYKILEGRS